jgi:hypothetical protein
MSLEPARVYPGAADVAAAGEHFVLSKLYLQGLVAALCPPGIRVADIVVFSPEMAVGSMVQVKSRSRGSDRGWMMQQKHEDRVHERLFYVFVDFEPSQPASFIVPSAEIAAALRASHAAWLAMPGVGGRPHRDNPMRRVLPDYRFTVPGYQPGWLDQYAERWGFMTGADGKGYGT